jgi:hypothetical protein
VEVPSLEMILKAKLIPPAQAVILEVVWKAKGWPVPTQRVFDAMYADDPDGGPSNTQMYSAFKQRLFRLRENLEGTGVDIVNVGYGQGYRLIMKGQD